MTLRRRYWKARCTRGKTSAVYSKGTEHCSMTKALEVGVDIGGTFTDVVSRDEEGNLKYFKVLTTRKDESIAVLGSVRRVSEEWGVGPKVIERFAHGTTVATNAILERKGARVGLITTRGF